MHTYIQYILRLIGAYIHAYMHAHIHIFNYPSVDIEVEIEIGLWKLTYQLTLFDQSFI